MRWRKQGLIFSPAGRYPWMQTHAANPVVLPLGGDLYRAYFATRDEQNRSHVGFIEFNLHAPKETLRVSEKPVLAPGPLGYFDDHGVYASSMVKHGPEIYLYYIGWNPGPRSPLFYTSIGLAVSRDGGETFEKMFKAPLLSRSEFDPWMVSAPFVMLDEGRWRMWYISGLKWEEVDAVELVSYYHIKYAESLDGIEWKREGLVCLDLLPGERNIARPCVIKDEGIYKAWYSYNKGAGYKIGYAESMDGNSWKRLDDEAGIEVSESGWDSKALAYPSVFSHEGRRYMLYNGNDFGKEGIGLAVEV
jgi:predicted GH43/DUF377 family glycosyl hydrolase